MSSVNSPSAQNPPAGPAEAGTPEYAFWTSAAGGLRIEYSLPLFHELDFQVSEGYRRIPHGGIEIGGFLWGRIRGNTVTVEAFRQIACEHASGPSFLLSDHDREGATEQLTNAGRDEELRDLLPVGWFISHTRGPLTLTDRESALFDEWFPEPTRFTMLVKPERFQPTRFGFLPRQADRSVGRDAAPEAFILPLPGRAGKGISASIPAPAPKTVAPKPASVQELVPKSTPTDLPPAVPEQNPDSSTLSPAAQPLASQPPLPAADVPAPAPPKPVRPFPPIAPPAAPSVPAVAAAVAETPAAPPPPKPVEQFRGFPSATPESERLPLTPPPARNYSVLRLFFLLLLAAALGCGVGYFAYLQLPSPYIPLQAERHAANLVVRWPAEQTRGVDIAAVRINDGQPQALTTQQKDSGEFEIQPPTGNTKVELIAQHWIRDSRGIIRYLNAEELANPAPASAPAAAPQGSPAP